VADQLLHASQDDRRDVYIAAGGSLGIPAAIVEKDVWICWTLDVLFSNPDALPMAFKGGTSLSKAFSAIKRFSEDIDLTIGFEELARELPASRKQRNLLGDRLRGRVADHVEHVVQPLVARALNDEFSEGQVTILDGETLIVDYPSCFEKRGGYVFESVKVEFGGRNSIEPHEQHRLTTYVANLDFDVEVPVCVVDVLSPARTFWEKVTLAHAECGLSEWRHDGDRFARHWYDLAMLADHDIGERALKDRALLADVVRIKNAFWYRGSAQYEQCLVGECRLVPQNSMRDGLRRDYEAMIDAGMFSVSPPSFDEIIGRLYALEEEINRSMSAF